MKFLAAETEADFEMVAERNPQIQKAVVRIKELSADERARMIFESREKYERDHRARLDDARWEGELRGVIKGERNGAVKVAQRLILRGRPIEEIVEDTGLTYSEVEELRNEK